MRSRKQEGPSTTRRALGRRPLPGLRSKPPTIKIINLERRRKGLLPPFPEGGLIVSQKLHKSKSRGFEKERS
ncbi:MAG: hypothetical protein DRP01_10130 [Archaeoglobales archaeon]|nr:MAG: hypothetical protein DRP01_10130 [Archaeoglobales archaeon]